MIRTLIVDDSAFLRSILKRCLEQTRVNGPLAAGCVLTEAATKSDALRKFQEERPDLVLLDIVMDQGERDGVELLAAILGMDPGARVIMMSAVGQDSVINECLGLGAASFVLKPFDEEQVVAAIDSAFATAARP